MIVVLGDIAVDIVSTLRAPLLRGSDAPASVRAMPGGSGANVAVWLARLGQPVTFIGRIGDDIFGRWLADDLRAEGVRPELVVDQHRNTAAIQVLVEPGGERTMVPDRGANAAWAAGDIPADLIAHAELLHVVGYALLDRESQPGALAAMTIARGHGVPISLDPSSHGPLAGLGAAGFWRLVGHPDIVLPNRQEAAVLTGSAEIKSALDILHVHATTAVVKLDRDGCMATDGAQTVVVPASHTAIVNATGAGDAFDAGFLAAWCAGRGLEAACRAGVSMGTFAATLATTR